MGIVWQKLCQWILIPVVSFFVTKGVKLVRVYLWFKKTESDMEKSTQATVDKATAATSSEEKKEATEDALKKF